MQGPLPPRPPISLATSVVLALLVAGGVALFLEALAEGPLHFSFHTEDRSSLSWSEGNRTLRLRSRGRVELTPNADGVLSISEGGFLRVRERHRGPDKEVEIRQEATGLVYEYRVGRSEEPFGEEARQWFATTLEDLADHTGFGAEERARARFAEGGTEAVLAHVDRVGGDTVARISYFVLLDEVSDPGERAEVLGHAVRRLESDYSLHAVLDEYLDGTRGAAGEEVFLALRELEADYYAYEVLERIADDPLDAQARQRYLEAVDDLDADYHRREALSALLDHQRLDAAGLAELVSAIAKLDSEHSRVTLLSEIAPEVDGSSPLAEPFFRTLRAIDTGYQRQQILERVLQNLDRWPALLGPSLASIKGISTEYHRAELLGRVVGALPPGEAAVLAVLDGIGGLESEHHLVELLDRLASRRPLSEAASARAVAIARQGMAEGQRREELVARLGPARP